ncbi:amino acid adenylation domain-containing protein [Nocardia sp. bgisy118]|uniref:amino acid adenylation domain-containing protein n=1 Tax=Nocardia sp. bgisy118 TaxID=3413786 RepID=UPI003F4A6A40
MTDTAMSPVDGFRLAPSQLLSWSRLADRRIQCRIEVRGASDAQEIQRALHAVVARHEPLRTRLIAVDGLVAPLQQVDDAAVPYWQVDPLGEPSEVDAVARAERAAGPEHPVRARLLTSTDVSVLLLTVSATLLDRRSCLIVAEDLIRELAGAPLPEVELQYLDAAEWLHEQNEAGDVAARGGTWRNGVARARSLSVPFESGEPAWARDNEVGDTLVAAASATHISARAVLLTAWHVLLWRLTGDTDITTLVLPTARGLDDLASVVGHFESPIPVRTPIRGNESFRDLAAEVEQLLHAAEEDQFGVAGDEPESAAPFTFSYLPLPAPATVGGAEIAVTTVDGEPDSALHLQAVGHSSGAVTVSLLPGGPSVSGTAATRALHQLGGVLRAVAEWPDAPLADLGLAEGEQRIRALAQAAGAVINPAGPLVVHHRILASAARTPDRVAVVCGEDSLTYRDLCRRSTALAQAMRAAGVHTGSVVPVIADRSADYVVGLLAVLQTGAAFVPVDPAWPTARIEQILADTAPAVLLTHHGRYSGDVPALAIDAEHGGDTEDLDDVGGLGTNVSPEDLAYLVYTSGTTGRPKGVAVPHRALCGYLDGLAAALDLPKDGVLATLATPAADLGYTAVFGALCAGRTLMLVRTEEVLAPAELLRRFRDRPIDLLKIVPSHLAALLDADHAQELLPSRFLLLGGEQTPVDLVARVHALRPGLRIVNHYGPTESTVGALVAREVTVADSPVPIGYPLGGYRAYLLDDQLRPVLDGALGELFLAGAGLAHGYWRRPAATADSFLPDPFTSEPGRRMYRTGDRARRLPDGSVVFLGRADTQVKIRGNRVEPGEIESLIRDQYEVTDAVVVARADDRGDTQLVAYVAARRTAGIEPAEVTAYLRERLPEYMVPAAVLALPTLPLTANGKVDRRALPAPESVVSRAEHYVEPATDTERALAALWEGVLGVPQIGSRDDFFLVLGGNSLDATRVVARLGAATGLELPVSDIFEAPTVAELAARVDAAREHAVMAGAIEPVDRSGPLPLGYAQRRLWVLSQVDGATAAYNIPAAIRIDGALNTVALQDALTEVVRRHEVLRTNLVIVDEEPRQMIRDPAQVPLPVVTADEAEILSMADEFAGRTLDLAEDELLRAMVLRVSEHHHVLLLCLHHVVSDGWSTGLLWREVSALYEAYAVGRPSPLSPPPIQYADYTAWQNDSLASPEQQAHLDYWRAQLADLPALLELPADRPRPAVQGFDGASIPIDIDAATTEMLRRLAGGNRGTMFMVVLSAFATVLSRYTGASDIAVGTPIANRTRAEVEQLLGCFFNTLVVRIDASGDPAFTELLDRVRTVMIAAQAHQEVPFELVVDALNPPRDPGHTPLFQVLFVYQQDPGENAAMGELAVRQLPLPSAVAKYDLTLDLVEREDGIGGRIEYRTDLFDADTIERLAGHVHTLLAAIGHAPTTRLSDLDLMSATERELVGSGMNAGYRAPGPIVAGTVTEFEQQVQRKPDAVALVCGARELSFAELDRAANRLANHLRAQGARPQTPVGIRLRRSPELVIAMLAVMKASAAYLPLDPAAPPARTAYLIADAGARLVLAGPAERDGLPDGIEVVDPAVLDGMLDPDDDTAPDREAGPDHPAYVIYTSGSTGQPKGVVITQRNLHSFCAAMDDRFGDSVPGTWLALTSHTFDISVLELLWSLTRGYRVVLGGDELAVGSAQRPAAHRPMDFSLFYFASDTGDRGDEKYRLLLEGARFADEHGFAAVWTPERHFGAFGGLYPNPTVTSAALAAVTSTIGIRTGSLVLPLHNPIRVAEDWAMIDNLSGGRIGLSFASGWQPRDFALAPGNYADRKDVMFRDIETVRTLWRGGSVRTRSGTGEEIDVRTLPRPVQPELPVWITAAGSPDTFRRAGAAGANLLTHLLGQSVDELATAIRIYRQARQDAGHDGPGHVSLMLHTFVGDDDDQVRALVRDPFRTYLSQSVELVRPLAVERGLELETFDAQDQQALLDHAFDRYYETSGLFGTPQRCAAMVDKLKLAGVDEIACLIDFGVGTDEVLAGLRALDQVRRDAMPVARDDTRQDVAALLERHQVTHLQCTPSVARLLSADEECRAALRGLDWLLIGGEALDPVLASALSGAVGGNVLNVYGPTEATVWATSHLVTGADTSIGQPLSNTKAYVVDERLRPVPIGIVGELVLGGEGVAPGYLRRPTLTAEKFVPDPFTSVPGARLYRTGDLVRRRPDGTLQFLGRRDHQVKIHGFRVELGEIEAYLTEAPGVRAAAVLAADDGRGGKRLVAYVVLDGEPADWTALRRHLESRLPRQLVPAAFVELSEMPLLASGKADRRALPDPDPAVGKIDGSQVPVTRAEQELARIWSQLLGVPRVGTNDNFFALGGDSIIAIQMVSRARRAGIEFSARDLFGNQTLGELAAIARAGSAIDADQGPVTGETPLTPIQHWFFEQDLADPAHYNQAVLLDVNDADLDLQLLAAARDAVVSHHDALRNRFDLTGARQHTVGSHSGGPIAVLRLDGADEQVRMDTLTRLHTGLDLADGPLLRMAYLDFGVARPAQVCTVIHHTVIDGISWRVLLEDLQLAYTMLRAGQTPAFPPKTTSYQRWAEGLVVAADSPAVRAELGQWTAQVALDTAVLPRDYAAANTERDAATLSVEFTAAETATLLREVRTKYRAEVPEVLLFALADAVTEWTGDREILLDVEGHGRENLLDGVDISRTVGWFTAMYPVRLRLPGDRGPADLTAVRDQLRAIPGHGLGFGLLRYLSADPQVRSVLAGAERTEIVFNYLGQADASRTADALFRLSTDPVGPPHGPAQRRRHLLNINGLVADGQLRVDFTYCAAVHKRATIAAVCDTFAATLRRALTGELGVVGFSEADLREAGLTVDELDDLFNELASEG